MKASQAGPSMSRSTGALITQRDFHYLYIIKCITTISLFLMWLKFCSPRVYKTVHLSSLLKKRSFLLKMLDPLVWHLNICLIFVLFLDIIFCFVDLLLHTPTPHCFINGSMLCFHIWHRLCLAHIVESAQFQNI